MNRPTEQSPYVFVYGTLMSGYGNNRLLKKSEFIGVATTKESYILLAYSIPFLVEEKGDGYVSGEVYKVSESTLKNLDTLENHPSWYERKIISVVNELGDTIKSWAYFMPREEIRSGTIIKSGNYRDYTQMIDGII